MTRDTGRARLPALPPVSTGNPSLDAWMRAVAERLEIREGSRGNPYERVVTLRELDSLGLSNFQFGGGSGSSVGGVLVQQPGGGFTQVPMDAFAEGIRSTKLYKDLMTRLDSVSRFDDVPESVRALLLSSLADEATQRGADIRRVESKLQNATESLAYTLQEVTAAVEGAASGVRDVSYASAQANRATAGKVTQLVAALDGTGSATIEDSLVVIADRTDGVRAQYMLKMNANNAVAGIGLMASEDPTGATESIFLVQADKFAVLPTYTFVSLSSSVPTATAIGQTWYQTDTEVSKIATATGTGSWVTYTTKIPFAINTATGKIYIRSDVEIDGNLLVAGSIQGASLAADSIDGKTITGATIKTAATGSRWVLEGGTYCMQISGYFGSESTPRMLLDSADGTVNFSGRSSTSVNTITSVASLFTLSLQNTGGGNALKAESNSGFGAELLGNATKGSAMLTPLASLPSDRSNGSVCFYNGNICIANGVHWYTPSSMTQLT